MNCPSCGASVEAGADLCLECGEPMGDSPAARVARSEKAPPKPVSTPTNPPPPVAPAAAKPAAPIKKKWREEEPEPRRCPGCGTKTLAARCPGCGTKLIHDE